MKKDRLCERSCKYQYYSYLSENDSICPFFYRELDCYKETKFDEKEIDKYFKLKWENARTSN